MMDFRKYLSAEERETQANYLKSYLEIELRNATMLLTALYSGARASELLAIEWTDLDFKTGQLWLRTLKGGEPREVYLPRFLLAPLLKLKSESPLKPFPISYNRLGDIWREYRVVPKKFHALRHSFAMHAYGTTKDIVFTKEALGHKSITNTMVYVRSDNAKENFKKMNGAR